MSTLKNFFNKLFIYQDTNTPYTFSPRESVTNNATNILKGLEPKNFFSNLNQNLNFLKVKYNILLNNDVVFREFNIHTNGKKYSALLIFIDGLVDSKSINNFILKPLMLLDNSDNQVISEQKINNVKIRKIKKFDLAEYLFKSLIPQNDIKKIESFNDLFNSVNSGNCVVLVDSINIGFDFDVKGFKQRNIDSPNNELVIRGAQEAFVENIRTNTSILRRIINNENLIIENINVGKITKTKTAVCYLKNICNDDLIAEVKFRINNLNIDYLISSGQLEQLIQDNGESLLPQILATERPDKTVNHLVEGRVVVIVNGSPYALIMPGILNDFISSPEDINIKFQFSNLLKIIRLIALFITLFFPGLYIAITTYHQELIPTELLFAISSSRNSVPFPIIFEILLMEVSFELIREAGLRVPSPIGPTLSIVGALILGEAAVSANLVSPILIIVVAITAICSFCIPDFSLNFTLRIYRFAYIILGYICGFLGIGAGLFIQLILISNLNSFGSPYISSFLENINHRSINSFFVPPIWKRERKSKFINAKKKFSQGKISMLWKNKTSNN